MSDLEDLSEFPAEKGQGTYRYMGSWEMIDQVIVSGSLLSAGNRLIYKPGDVKNFQTGFSYEKGSEVSGPESLFNLSGIPLPGRVQRPSAGTA